MKKIRSRLTYANVMSSLALFFVLAGGTAFAASQLGKNSVGSPQLKKNAVTSAKIKKNAVTTAKIKASAVTTGKLKKGAVTAAKINLGSTPFGRIVAKLRNAGPVAFGSETPVSIGTYAQPPGETDQFIAGLTVNWGSCAAPRQAIAFIARNPADPSKFEEASITAIGYANDASGASPTTKMDFSPIPVEGLFKNMYSYEPDATENQSFYAYLLGTKCASGGGATATNLGVNVVGIK